MGLFRIEREIPTIGPEIISQIGGFPITNTFLMSWFIIGLILIISIIFIRRFAMRPTRSQNVIESIYEKIVGLIEQVAGDRELAEKIFPLVGAIFVYIGISNFIGLIPGLTNITWKGVAIFRTPTNDYNTTFGLALAMVLLIQLASIRTVGFLAYLGKFFKFKEIFLGFKKGIGAGLFSIVDFFIGLLDIVSELAKVVSLSLRLFGNMYAGEVIATILLGAVAYVMPSLWLAMSMLSAIVQTIVFSALITIFYALAVKTEEPAPAAA